MKSFETPFLYILICLSLVGCKNKSTKGSVYFGGEIINPKNDYVTFYGSHHGYDTIKLDENNRFLKKFDSLPPGLYSFVHGGEYQMVLLEPNDSLMFRLNTIDFDESLAFTGIGAKKNNYLIKTFIEDEIENKKLNQFCQMSPEKLMSYLDSTKKVRLKKLDDFINKGDFSELFINIAKANINYTNYYYKEIYPFGYFGNNKLIHFKDLPEDYYRFRDSVNYNLDYMSNFHSYNRFLFSHFNNLALKGYYKDIKTHKPFNRHDLNYNIEKLHLIDSLVNDDGIKNNLLKNVVKEFIYNSKNKNETETILQAYLSKSSNENDKKSITNLVATLDNLQPNKPLPDIDIVGFNDYTYNLHNIITEPTVLFFWSSNFKVNFRNSHYKIRKLKVDYPNVNFIAININDDDKQYWKNTLKKLKFPTEYEFRFKDSKKAVDTLAINYVNKTFIIAPDKRIISSNTNLFSRELEDILRKHFK